MKKTSTLITRIALVTGLGLGAFALSAIAGVWTPPTDTPPNGNVDAPINVGGGYQIKTGLLGLNDVIIKNLQVLTSAGTTTTTQGKVLTALDNNGTVGWGSGGGTGGGVPNNVVVFDYASVNPGTNVIGPSPNWTWTVPAGVTKVRVRAWGGGGGGGIINGNGGGAGGYGESVISVTPNTPYLVKVGGGGAGPATFTSCATSGHDGTGGNGSASSFGPISGSSYVTANGGGGGLSWSCFPSSASNAIGGSASAQISITGGDGDYGAGFSCFTHGGNAPLGGLGGRSASNCPTQYYGSASVPGGGGTGFAYSPTGTTTATQLQGANGRVIIEY